MKRLSLLAALGALELALQLVLRGQSDVWTQVAGQLVAFALFVPAAVLCWRGLRAGRLGIVVVLLFAVGFRFAAFAPGAPPPLTTDLYRYAWDARVTVSGTNPYRYAPADPHLRRLRDREVWPRVNLPDWRTPYPPGAQGAFVGARGIFGHGPRATSWLILAADAAAVALLGLVLARAHAPLERVGLYAWHPLAVSEIAANGHLDALAVLSMAALLAAWQTRRFTLAGLAVAIGSLIKFWPVLLAPSLARRGGVRFLAPLALIPLAYLPFLSVGTGVLGSLVRFERLHHFGSLAYPLTGLVGSLASHALIGLALGFVVTAVALRDHKSVEQVARSALLVLGTLLIVLEYLQPWYAVVLLPALVLVPAPGWIWLTGTLPLLYLYADNALPPWVRPVVYGPLALWALGSLLTRRRVRRTQLPPLPQRPRVAGVVPALNEEEALPHLLAEIPAGVLDDVIVVDGGSRDTTVRVARAGGARVVEERRRGYGRACAAGVASTDADVIVFLDGDGSDDPAFLQRVLAPVLAGEAALALGGRRDHEAGAVLLHQRLGNVLVAALIRLLYGVRLHDVPPMRAVRREVLNDLALSEMTYGWPTEMVVKAARAGLPIVEVPVRSRARRGGESKIAGRAWPSARAGALMLAVVARHA
jgi:hypothetical protein